MKILLVVYDNESYIHWFPQGLAYIAAVLEKEGRDVQIYNQDVHHYPDSHLTRYLDEHAFEMVGIGVVAGYYQYRKLLALSKAINASRQRPFYVIGGYGPSPEPEFFLRKTQADAVVIGEGELTIVELAQAVAEGRSLEGIKGIAYRENDSVVVNERRSLIEDIDVIPWPAYHLFPMEYYRLIRRPNIKPTEFSLPLLSGRGCPFKCTFCYRMDEGFRPRSNEAIIEEIEFLKTEYNVSVIGFLDDLLMSSKARIVSLCQDFLKRNSRIRWTCNGRLNFAKPDVLKLMKQAGCIYINYGVEAMDDQVLRNMKKGLTTRQIIEGTKATLEAGISPGLNIIFGNIGDNADTLKRGVEFLLKYDDGARVRTIRPVTPYPGSELYYYAIEHGSLRDVEDFYENKHLNSDLLSVNFTDLSDDEFYQCLLEANKRLLDHHYQLQRRKYIKLLEDIYLKRDASYRGFRQT